MKTRWISYLACLAVLAGCAAPPEVKISKPAAAIQAAAGHTPPAGQSAPAATGETSPGISTIQAAKQKTAADPMNWRGFNELGLAYYKAKMLDQAIAAFEQALVLHPITTRLETEKKQQEMVDAQRSAETEEKKRLQKYQQDSQNAAAMSSIFSSLLGTMPAMPGVSPDAALMLPTVGALQSAASQPDVPGVVEAPRTVLESELKPKREIAGIYYNLGLAHFEKGNYSQAVQALDNSLSCDPSRVEVLWWEAEATFRQGSYQKSIALMNRYLAVGSANPEPASYARLSQSFRALGLNKDADRAFLAAVQEYKRRMAAAPDDTDTARGLASCYMANDCYADAEQLVQELCGKLDSSESTLDLASIQLLQSKHSEALQKVKEVLDKGTCKEPARAWYIAGRAYDELGSTDESTRAYRKSAEFLDAIPAGSTAPFYAPVVRAATGHYEEARKEIDSQITEDPSGIDAPMNLFRLGLVCEKGGNDVDAIEAFNRTLSSKPRFTHAISALNRLEKKNADLRKQALADAEAALAQSDKNTALLKLTAAFQLMVAGQQKEQTLQKILRLVAGMDAPPPLTMTAQRHYLRGNAALKSAKEPVDLDRAIYEFQWAALYSPWAAPVYLNSSAAYSVRLRYGKAMDTLKLFLTASPRARNVEDALNKLAELEYKQEESMRALSFK